MNVQSIVTDAIYLSLQDREFEPTINGGYEERGLKILNFILDEWRDQIPYPSHVIFNDAANLTATTFVAVDTVNFVLNNTTVWLPPVSLTMFEEIKPVIGLKGFPQFYYFDELAQSIMVYPEPSMPAYQFRVWGRIGALNLGLFDEIPTNIPPFMVNALTYELALRLCGQYGKEWSDTNDRIYKSLMVQLRNKKAVDLTAPINSAFGSPTGDSNTAPFPFLYYLSGGGA